MSNDLRVTQSPLADEEKGSLGVMPMEDLQDLSCEYGVRTVIEGQGHQRKVGSNSIQKIWGEPFNHTEESQGLYPKHEESDGDNGTTNQENHRALSVMLGKLSSH
jgi:hypothetical protein